MLRLLLLCAFIPLCLISFGQDNEKLYKKYNSLIENGKKEQAISVLNQIANNNKDYFFKLSDDIKSYAKSNEIDSIKSCMWKMIELHTVNPMPTTTEYVKKRNDTFNQLIPILSKFIENDSNSRLFCDLAIIKHAIGLNRAAIIDYGLAIKYDSTNSVYYYDRAGIYREINELDSSIADYTKALKIDPKFGRVYLNRGFTYLKMELYEKAIYDLERVERYSNEATSVAYAFNNMGYAYYKLGKLELAEEKVNYSINIYPSNSYAYYHLALIKIEQKDSEKACQYIAKSLILGFTNEYGDEVQKLQDQHCKR